MYISFYWFVFIHIIHILFIFSISIVTCKMWGCVNTKYGVLLRKICLHLIIVHSGTVVLRVQILFPLFLEQQQPQQFSSFITADRICPNRCLRLWKELEAYVDGCCCCILRLFFESHNLWLQIIFESS